MLNELAQRIYNFNETMGWHSGPPDLAKFLMNLHAEVSELWEAWRTGDLEKPCDKAARMMELGAGVIDDASLPCGRRPMTCIEEELADILIRTLDTARAFGVDIDKAVAAKMAYNATRGHRYGGKLA